MSKTRAAWPVALLLLLFVGICLLLVLNRGRQASMMRAETAAAFRSLQEALQAWDAARAPEWHELLQQARTIAPHNRVLEQIATGQE